MGYIFGTILLISFTAPYVIEFEKEVQEPWEADMILDMGQILSIPFILVGIFMLWYSGKLLDSGNNAAKSLKK